MTTTASPAETVKALGLEVQAEFVPWSQSRNRNEKERSLNWRVTVTRNGQPILTTDYSAGIGHCPGYKQGDKSYEGRKVIEYETERGKAGHYHSAGDYVTHKPKTESITPDPLDVLYSLSSDSDVLDFPGFEDWASDFGYDTDSRSAEATYRACLEIALKLRSAIGDDGLQQLREAFQDY